MVRVGGGWDTLEHYLDKHDPCRCSSTGWCPRPGQAGGGPLCGSTPHMPPVCPLQCTARPRRGPRRSPRRGCHPLPAPERAAQPQGVSGEAPGQR